MSKAPVVCSYCDGHGKGTSPENPCGFCVGGKPLDTQEDWDNSWGRVFKFIEELKLTEGDEEKIVELLKKNEKK